MKIKNVKYKVRDLALSLFSNNYIAIDTHIIRVISRIGLILYSYQLGFAPSTKIGDDKVYLNNRNLLITLAENTALSLGELDRALWNYGRTICTSRNPKCKICPILDDCVLHKYKKMNLYEKK